MTNAFSCGRQRNYHAPRIEKIEGRQLLSTTIYVDQHAPGAVQDGTSWETAYINLQPALSAASSDTEIKVADGEYTPESTGDSTFQLKNGVSVLGGFAGYGAGDPDARDPGAFETIIRGQASGLNTGVITGSGTDSTAVIDGVVVKSNGFSSIGLYTANGSPTINNCAFTVGGGIRNVNASPTITNCTFTNLDGQYTSGINSTGSSPTISNCTFANNFGVTGGAMSNTGGAPVIVGCTFTGNRAAHEGQAVYNANSSPTLIDCVFQVNGDPTEHGGAIYCNATATSTLTVRNCQFIENRAVGGGAIDSGGSTLVVESSTFTRNAAMNWGGAIYGSGDMTITSSIFQGNTAYYSGTIDASSATVRITNSLFAGNEAGTNGMGGALTLTSASAIVTNCTFGGNRSGNAGGAFWLEDSSLELRNTLSWGNSAAGDGDEIYLYPSGSSSVAYHNSVVAPSGPSQSPFLRAPSPGADGYYGTPDDDYGDLRPMLDNPTAEPRIVDGGDNFYLPAGITTDIAGNPRIVDVFHDGANVDVGAYEYQLPLKALSGSYVVDAPAPTVAVKFNGDLNFLKVEASDLILLDPVTNRPLGIVPASRGGDVLSRTATWSFSSPLPDGNYRALLKQGSIEDRAGNPLAADFTFDFFVLGGDANRDRHVDNTDLGILSSNWNAPHADYSHGDFNYDGQVDVADFKILTDNWQKTLAPPESPATPVLSPATSKKTRTITTLGV
jgi:predicted outer membrane repeat protein